MGSMESAISKVNQVIANYLESQSSLWEKYVSPKEAYLGPDGDVWQAIGGGGSPYDELPYQTVTELWQIQTVARILYRDNAIAKNAHRNRQNYIIGTGHVYTVVGKSKGVPQAAIDRVKDVLDTILRANKWAIRQQEIKLRDDRDGETFIRKFGGDDGIMRFRFVEPRQIHPPPDAKPHQALGVETLENDRETIVNYWVDGSPVEACHIQHRKWNTDSSISRGYPLLYPVRRNLVRAGKLLQNMSTATEIQTAIALIRKHQNATKDAVRAFVAAKADSQTSGGRNILEYPAGSIVDVPHGLDYDIPPQLDPTKTIAALQAELRFIAALLVMPEFMLTSDASNANFASTMVAEGPACKNFQAEQELQISYDLELFNSALQHAANSGLLTQLELEQTKVQAEGPSVAARDQLKEAQTRQIDMGLGILSPQTATSQINYDYDQEQTNIELHQEKSGGLTQLSGETGGGSDSGPIDPSSVSGTALNGIQIQSLKDIIGEVSRGELPEAAGRELIFASFPMMPMDQVDKLLASVRGVDVPDKDNQ